MTDNEKQQRVKSIMQKLETAFFATFPGVNEKWTDRIEEGYTPESDQVTIGYIVGQNTPFLGTLRQFGIRH